MAIRVTPGEFPKEIRQRFKRIPAEIAKGMNHGAMEGARILAKRTPRTTGATAARWRVRKGKRWANQHGSGMVPPEVYNDAPHVGVLELGARPHPVNAEGIAALTRWAQLKLGLTADEAKMAAHAIAWKIRKKGAKPTYFVRDSMDDLAEAMGRGISKAMAAYAKRRASRRGGRR